MQDAHTLCSTTPPRRLLQVRVRDHWLVKKRTCAISHAISHMMLSRGAQLCHLRNVGDRAKCVDGRSFCQMHVWLSLCESSYAFQRYVRDASRSRLTKNPTSAHHRWRHTCTLSRCCPDQHVEQWHIRLGVDIQSCTSSTSVLKRQERTGGYHRAHLCAGSTHGEHGMALKASGKQRATLTPATASDSNWWGSQTPQRRHHCCHVSNTARTGTAGQKQCSNRQSGWATLRAGKTTAPLEKGLVIAPIRSLPACCAALGSSKAGFSRELFLAHPKWLALSHAGLGGYHGSTYRSRSLSARSTSDVWWGIIRMRAATTAGACNSKHFWTADILPFEDAQLLLGVTSKEQRLQVDTKSFYNLY